MAVSSAAEPYRGDDAVLPFDESCAAAYAGVLDERERAGLPISTAETLDDVPSIHGIYCDPRVWTHLPSGRYTTMSVKSGWCRDGSTVGRGMAFRSGSSGMLRPVPCWVT